MSITPHESDIPGGKEESVRSIHPMEDPEYPHDLLFTLRYTLIACQLIPNYSSPLRDYFHPVSSPSYELPATSRRCQSAMSLFLFCFPAHFQLYYIRTASISHIAVTRPERSGPCSLGPEGRVHSPL